MYLFTRRYLGYIFSTGDMVINTGLPAYLGTIVSEGDITVNGEKIDGASFRDRGTIIAHGDVNIEMQRAAMDQVAIQAQNISVKVIEDFILNDVIRPTVLPDGMIIHMLDLRKLAHSIGMIINDDQLIQLQTTSPDDASSAEDRGGKLVTVRDADGCGFIREPPARGLFIPTLPNDLLRSILNLILAPVHGRETLVRGNLIVLLERMGRETSHGESTETTAPAILYRPSEQQDVEVVVNGESILVPLYDPHLLFDATSRIANLMETQRKTSINSLGNIQINPGEISINTVDISLGASGKVAAMSRFIYSPTGETIGIDQATLEVPGDITISGDQEVEMQAAKVTVGEQLAIRSEHGHVIDHQMVTDMRAYRIDEDTAIQKSKPTATSLVAGKGIAIKAREGKRNSRHPNAGGEGRHKVRSAKA
jgi:hypothetical protein